MRYSRGCQTHEASNGVSTGGGAADEPERWLSGRRQRFAKPSYGLHCTGGSNPPLSAISAFKASGAYIGSLFCAHVVSRCTPERRSRNARACRRSWMRSRPLIPASVCTFLSISSRSNRQLPPSKWAKTKLLRFAGSMSGLPACGLMRRRQAILYAVAREQSTRSSPETPGVSGLSLPNPHRPCFPSSLSFQYGQVARHVVTHVTSSPTSPLSRDLPSWRIVVTHVTTSPTSLPPAFLAAASSRHPSRPRNAPKALPDRHLPCT